MKPYRVFIAKEVYEALPRIRLTARRKILAFIDQLLIEPDAKGDFVENDETGRVLQVKIIGDYALTFWHDSPVREVKIDDLSDADKL